MSEEFGKDYFLKLEAFIDNAYRTKEIYPPKPQIYRALELCPPSKIKVVILGQDPYHGLGQACGLSFSVQKGTKIPPSLKNIFKEVYKGEDKKIPTSGDLSAWAKQGVLLLNAVLTVEASKAASHRKQGWERFTDVIITKISRNYDSIVFLLWGNFAQSKARLIDTKKHLILKSVHPSPLSAYRGFFGCNHFELCNNYLKTKGIETINWKANNTETLTLKLQ